MAVKYALRKVIERHANLCYGVAEKSANTEAHFVRLERIEWSDVVEFQESKLPSGSEDDALSKQLGTRHQHLWREGSKPAWKVVVLTHHNVSPGQGLLVDIAFISHHAIADGGSGCAFHKTLLYALHDPSSIACSSDDLWPFIVLETIAKPVALEDAINFAPAQDPILAESAPVTSSDASETWTAAQPSLPSIEEYKSRVSIVTVPAAQVANILTTCRRLGITLTGLLHALIVIQLSRSVPQARRFEAVTPYSMRRFTNLSPDEVANHISYIINDWDSSVLDAARELTETSREEEDLIKRIAKYFQDEIADELARVPSEGPLILKAVSKINDYDQFCKEGIAKKRESTYELSNIGAVKLASDVLVLEEGVKLENLIFTQCGMVVGPAIGCSVISVQKGPLTVSLHWQEGGVEQELMDGLKACLKRRLSSF